ncbi:MAG: LytTR family DNA-binding domain-containing protein [Reinekea sp.]
MTQLIIADDEPLLRFHLQKLLGEVWPEADVLAQAANGDEALSLIQELQPDVVFLDIQMPGMTGLEVALHLTQQAQCPTIVFLTAYDQYAVEAFDHGAVDYLLKPLDEARLQKTVHRLQQRLQDNTQVPPVDLDMLLNLVNNKAANTRLQWLTAQQGDVVKVIAVEEATLGCEQGEFLLRQSIKQLEEQLDVEQFWRIHRSTLVNMKHVDRIEKSLAGQMSLYIRSITKPLPVSRAKQYLFKAL